MAAKSRSTLTSDFAAVLADVGDEQIAPSEVAGLFQDLLDSSFIVEDADGAIQITINGGGAVIATGVLPCDVVVPDDREIIGWELLSQQSGSIVIDVWKSNYANFPPLDGNSITASAPPTLSAAVKNTDYTLSGWTNGLTAGDILRFNVDSVTNVQVCVLVIHTKRSAVE